MKKTFVTFALTALSVICCASSYEGCPLDLSVNIIDDTPIAHDKGKSPIRMPAIWQDGHTISFQSYHPEYIINIVQDGEMIFSSVIPADVALYDLPGYVSGECVIQFIRGNYCFWAEIEL